MARFITIAGKKQVGKDTSAGMINKLISPPWTCDEVQADPERYLAWKDNVHVVHFADALKVACTAVFGITPEDMETEEGKQKLTDVLWPADTYDGWFPCSDPNNTPVGEKNATFGTPQAGTPMTVREVLQFVGTELLRTQLDPDVWVKSVYRRPWAENEIVVVADCRFPNEAEFARENGVLISVERDTGIPSDGHISETVLDDYHNYHHVVDNNGSFDDLRKRLRYILILEGFLSA